MKKIVKIAKPRCPIFVGSHPSSCFASQAMLAGYVPEGTTGGGSPRT